MTIEFPKTKDNSRWRMTHNIFGEDILRLETKTKFRWKTTHSRMILPRNYEFYEDCVKRMIDDILCVIAHKGLMNGQREQIFLQVNGKKP